MERHVVRALWVPIDTCLKQAYEEASHGAHIFGATDFMGRILLASTFSSRQIYTGVGPG